jgi:predicted GNAT family acetyltransferase
VHTEVYPKFEGKGVGGALAKAALDDIAHRQLTIVPECEFVKGYLEKHPEYAEHVAG